MGFLLWSGSIGLVIALTWWLRRWQQAVDDYQERQYRDPPAFDGGSFMGGDRL